MWSVLLRFTVRVGDRSGAWSDLQTFDGSVVVAEDQFGDTTRFGGTFDLKGAIHGDLQAAGDVFDAGKLGPETNVGSNRDRRWKANLVGTVVDAHLYASDLEHATEKHRCEGKREVPVRNWAAERAGFSPLNVEVNPLVIARCVSKKLNLLLGYLVVLGVSEVFADVVLE